MKQEKTKGIKRSGSREDHPAEFGVADPLAGTFLVATPSLRDPRFQQTLIFLCAHSLEGSMGIVVNRPNGDLTLGELIERLDEGSQPSDGGAKRADADKAKRKKGAGQRHALVSIVNGGPVEPGRGFVLHSGDYHVEGVTIHISDDIFLTASADILYAIDEERGPSKAIVALGYAGWSEGQLEREMGNNDWIAIKASADFLFEPHETDKYHRLLDSMGIGAVSLAPSLGHA